MSSITSCSPNMHDSVNTSSLDFASDSAHSKSFLSKKVLPTIRKIGNVAGKVATVTGKVATIAALI
jgi:hypothetical protein